MMSETPAPQGAALPLDESSAGFHLEGRPGKPSRPRALLVGPLLGFGGEEGLARWLEVVRASPAELVRALGPSAPDLVFLDGQLPSATLTELLEAVGRPGIAGRPAVIVLTEQGRRSPVESKLVDYADDFVCGSLSGEALLARVRVALRMRA